MKQLSIIVPTYNMERYLSKCLSSMIIENLNLFNELEVAVIIDGSTDNSVEIAKSFQEKYPNVFRVFEKENGNYGSCINYGLKKITGKYVKIIDADDSVDNHQFEAYLSFIRKCDTDVILSDYRLVNEEGCSICVKNRTLPTNIPLSWDEVISSFNVDMHVAMHELTYKTSVLTRSDYCQTENISYTDQEWIFYPMAHVDTFISSGINIYNYLVGREGQTMDIRSVKKNVSAHLKIALRMLDFLCEKQNRLEVNSYLETNFKWLLEYTYKIYLSFQIGSNNNDLKEFDLLLSNKKPKIHNLLNFSEMRILKTKYKYIKKWRENGYTKTLRLKLLSIYNG